MLLLPPPLQLQLQLGIDFGFAIDICKLFDFEQKKIAEKYFFFLCLKQETFVCEECCMS